MLGWRPLLLSWLNTLPEGVTQEIKDLITGFFDRMVIPVLQWLRKGNAKVIFIVFVMFVKKMAWVIEDT